MSDSKLRVFLLKTEWLLSINTSPRQYRKLVHRSIYPFGSQGLSGLQAITHNYDPPIISTPHPSNQIGMCSDLAVWEERIEGVPDLNRKYDLVNGAVSKVLELPSG